MAETLHNRRSNCASVSNGFAQQDCFRCVDESKTHSYHSDYTNDAKTSKVHPLLRGGQPPCPHSFSHHHMDVITALCDTIYPMSSPSPASCEDEYTREMEHSPCTMSSSAAWQVPEHVAGFFTRFVRQSEMMRLRLLLYLLSTRLGTFVLCGTNSFVGEFPYIQAFPHLPFRKREQSMRRWATSRWIRLQAFFKLLKGAAGWNYFARADSDNHNPFWKEIGYYIPSKGCSANHQERPLEGRVVDVKQEADLCSRLREAGFNVNDEDVEVCSKSKVEKVGMKGKEKDVIVECDAVIVGSGSGGGVVASVLAKAGFKVLVIEKGDYFAREDYSLIEGFSGMAMIEGPPVLSTRDGSIVLKAASTVGGGSAVNWSASLRTPDHVLKEWADDEKLGLFREEKYQKAMDAIFERMKVKVGFKKESLQNRVLREGCAKLGCHVEDVTCNVAGEHYCGWCEFGCATGGKQSTAETWLVDAVERGALILAGCKVQKVLHCEGLKKKRRATGVVADVLYGKLYVHAHVVVVAAGALQTPLLLRRSGLQNHHIGRNLHLHPSTLAWGYKPAAATDKDSVFEGGIITACCRELAVGNSGYGAVLQCPSIHPGAFAFIAPWVSADHFKSTMQRYSRTCMVFTLIRDRTCGSVAEDRNGSIVIDYQLSPVDKAMTLRALELAVRILAASPGVAEVGTMNVNADSSDPAHVDTLVERIASRGMRGLDYPIQSAHQMGTCRMGIHPSTSVVDPRGESWEVEGLFVGDTSVFPTAIGVNPMITAQAIAWCTSRNIIEYLKSS